jgi:hypothetical protein
MDLHETDPLLELEHGIAESIATLSFIVIRMVNARMGYSMVLNTIGSVEHFDRQRDARLRTIQMWMWLFEIASGLLIVLCVTSFVLFYHFVHLGWTIMSNQFCLITSMVLSELYMARVTISVVKIREDQHKVERPIFCPIMQALKGRQPPEDMTRFLPSCDSSYLPSFLTLPSHAQLSPYYVGGPRSYIYIPLNNFNVNIAVSLAP